MDHDEGTSVEKLNTEVTVTDCIETIVRNAFEAQRTRSDWRSMGNDVPASAAEPSGRMLTRRRVSLRRSRSRASISKYARHQWANKTGCARCRCV